MRVDVEAIVEAAVTAAGADAGMLMTPTNGTGIFDLLGSAGLADLLPSAERWSDGAWAPLLTQAALGGEPVISESCAGPAGLRSERVTFVCMPVAGKNGTLGVLVLLRRGGCPIPNGSRESLLALGRLCALALERCRHVAGELPDRETAGATDEWASALAQQLPEPLVVTDARGRIVRLNRRAEQTFGYTQAEVVGRSISVLLPDQAGASPPIGRRKDGGTFAAGVARGLIERDGEFVLAHLIRDVSVEQSRLRREEEFFADASHELRTPVATIKASAEVLADYLSSGTPKAVQRLAENIGRETERLESLVDDLLDLHSLQAGRLRLRPASCDLRDVACRAVRTIAPLARRRDQRLDLRLPGGPVPAVADVDLLHRALLNLLSNACKYGRHHGEIVVRLEAQAAEAVFAVSDDGPGVPEADLERIFQRLYRSPTAAGRRIQGSGLGLPICRAAVELHGGRVWAERRSGPGSVFRIALPLKDAPLQSTQSGRREHSSR
jgi:two-component system, OmpR family, phosphate regulon sensor histidine kinase PhoR